MTMPTTMAMRPRRRCAVVGYASRRHDALAHGNADDGQKPHREKHAERRQQHTEPARHRAFAVASAITGTMAVPAPVGPSTTTDTRYDVGAMNHRSAA